MTNRQAVASSSVPKARRPIGTLGPVLTAFLILAGAPVLADDWDVQPAPTKERLRGLSAPSVRVAWASGNRGTVLRTIDAGASWTRLSIPDADDLDFRDVVQ